MKELDALKRYAEQVKVFNRGERFIIAVFEALDKRIATLAASKKYHDDEIRKLRGQVAGLALAAGEDGHRISKLEGGIVASADALADLEYRHLKRIEALEESVGAGLEELPLSDEVAGLSGEFARMTEERNKLLQRIIALEESRFEVHNHKPIFDRLDALESDNEAGSEASERYRKKFINCEGRLLSLEQVTGIQDRCDGCDKIDECDHSRSKVCNLGGNGHPTCYVKQTCGRCKKPYWHTMASNCGLCNLHPSVKGGNPYAIGQTDEACPSFEAVE